MSAIGLLGFGSYAPARVMTNDDWAAFVDTSDEWITSRTGIKTRRIAAPDETTVDMAERAAAAALADAGVGHHQHALQAGTGDHDSLEGTLQRLQLGNLLLINHIIVDDKPRDRNYDTQDHSANF